MRIDVSRPGLDGHATIGTCDECLHRRVTPLMVERCELWRAAVNGQRDFCGRFVDKYKAR